ncbi:MAG: NUDIX hydrolase [Nitrososphaerales archaeon]
MKHELEEKYTVIDAGPEFVGKSLRVQKELVSDGGTTFFVDIVRFPDSVAILPIKENGMVILERHYRHPIKETILEVPAGKLEPNERTEDGARRELLEETGFEAVTIQNVGSIFAAPGYSTEIIHLFIAKVKMEGEHVQKLEPTERIRLEEFNLQEISELISKDELRDSMTISLIFIAKLKGMLK